MGVSPWALTALICVVRPATSRGPTGWASWVSTQDNFLSLPG